MPVYDPRERESILAWRQSAAKLVCTSKHNSGNRCREIVIGYTDRLLHCTFYPDPRLSASQLLNSWFRISKNDGNLDHT